MACYPGCYSICPPDVWAPIYLPNFCDAYLKAHEHPAHGRIYVMYHGTTISAAASIIQNGFRQSKDGMLGRGIYVTRDKRKALRYPLDDKRFQVVLKLRVNVGKVKKIDSQNHPLMKTWHAQGYDAAWVPPNSGVVPSGLEEDCIWDPMRIRVVGISHTALPQHKAHLVQLLKQHHQ